MAKNKILIIDDEPNLTKLLKMNFEREKEYEVRTENNSSLGLDAAREFKPDLILLDIAMPGMDGYTLASAIRNDSELKDTSILFMTGKEFDDKGIQERAADLGAYGYICKVCDFKDVLDKVKEVI